MGSMMSSSSEEEQERRKYVKPELLASALLGEVRESDYFGKAMHALTAFKLELPEDETVLTGHTANDALPLDEAHKLAEPGYLKMENGYVRCNDGSFYVAVLTNLGTDITGDMFDWWIRNCDSNEKFRWWHPDSHHSATWNPQFFAAMPHERNEGHYIDNTFVIEERMGSCSSSSSSTSSSRELVTFHIEYLRPSKYFDVDSFPRQGVTACLVARIHMKVRKMGLISVGHVVHTVRTVADGTSELRSRYWLGHIAYPETMDNFVAAGVINYVANTYLYRMLKLPTANARNTYLHCAQQMQCLKSFLPHYYHVSTTGDGIGLSVSSLLGGGGKNRKKKSSILEEDKPVVTTTAIAAPEIAAPTTDAPTTDTAASAKASATSKAVATTGKE